MKGRQSALAYLGQNLANRSEPECQMARWQLNKLVDILLTSKNTPAPIFIEQIREPADRIQSRDGKWAREATQK